MADILQTLYDKLTEICICNTDKYVHYRYNLSQKSKQIKRSYVIQNIIGYMRTLCNLHSQNNECFITHLFMIIKQPMLN